MGEWATFTVNGFTLTGLSAFMASVVLLYVLMRGLFVVCMDIYHLVAASQPKDNG